MSSDMEPVPVTAQKHDPAWKHCLMFKNGDRVQLKCIYCGKMFKGGGIHRIKEHLAGQKGNASTCLRVQPDVRLLMQESLSGVVMKKRKKRKLAEDVSNFNVGNSEVDNYNECGLNSEVQLLPVPDTVDPSSNLLLINSDEGTSTKTGGRKKKGRLRKASATATSSGLPLNHNVSLVKKPNSQVDMAIGRFFYHAGVPLEAVNSVYFQLMVDAIASQGAGVGAPTYHDLRSWILKNSVQDVRSDIDQCMGTWGKTGCSILVDEWMSDKGKLLVNFLVYCPEGTMFLRSVDVSDIINSGDALYELLKEVVEEVGVRNVLQVITKSEEHYAVAGKRMTDTFPTVFWTPCAAHCIDLILEDFIKLEWINSVLEKARFISRFIYSHDVVLNLMRRFTLGIDLVDLGDTRNTTDFLTLKRLVGIRHNLNLMVTSDKWEEFSCSKKPEGLSVLDYVTDQSFWSQCSLIITLTDPLLRLLRIVSSEKKPAMGYVYGGLYRAKENIKKEFSNDKEYLVYWAIIDCRWEQLQRHPLHAAGFYLNPKFIYSTEGDSHLNIRSLVYDCVERLVPEPKIQDKIVKETASYQNASGDFGRNMAIRARDNLLPAEWWSTYGGGCPNLARLAIRIVSQTCSLVRLKPNRVYFQQIHEPKNCIEHQRLTDLIFVQYNIQLKQMGQKNKEQEAVDPISCEHISVAEDWITEKESSQDVFGKSDWMQVDPPIGNIMALGESTDDIEALGAGFDDYEVFDGAKCSEDENGEEQKADERDWNLKKETPEE